MPAELNRPAGKKSFTNPHCLKEPLKHTMQQATHPKLKRTAFAFSVSLGLVSLLPGTVGAQDIRTQEILRRQQLTADAEALLTEGREAYAKGEYEEAVQKYRSALSKLPGGAMTEDRRKVIASHLADGSVALAQQYRRVGKDKLRRN